MLYGYARQSRKRRGGVSSSIEEQTEILQRAGCERIFAERRSGRKERAEFNRMMAEVRPGDVIIVKELSRLGRTALQLIKLFHDFTQKNIHFVAIKQGIDTRTQTGKLMFQLFSVLAENEIDQVGERTDDLIEYARERGRKGGRPGGLSAAAQK
ncbi:recombinase family protein, partial [Chitinophaga tropicalis]